MMDWMCGKVSVSMWMKDDKRKIVGSCSKTAYILPLWNACRASFMNGRLSGPL